MISKTNKVIKRVAFFGDAAAKETDEHYMLAYETAKLLAEHGYIIVNGGGPGVMFASTMGAKSVGGEVLLVVLDKNEEPDNYEGQHMINLSLADKVINTENYQRRLEKLVEVADAFIIFKGGTGTLSEVGLTWEMAKFEYGNHEPLVFVGRCWNNIVKGIIKDLDLEVIEQRVVEVVEGPKDVLKVLKRVAAKVKATSGGVEN